MSFFKNKDDTPVKWKEKYFDLLDGQEKLEKEYKTSQDLLCKTIIRFALAVKGLSKTLDPHLDRIRDLLKAGLKSQQLRTELEVFSNALMAMEDNSSSQLDATLLFDYLHAHFADRVTELQKIKQRYEAHEFINPQRLFIALAEILGDDDRLKTDDFANELALADTKAIGHHLIILLENADLPLEFIEEGKTLKRRLQTGQSLGPVFEDAVNLLLTIKKHLLLEQQEMADFLSTLTEELAELGLITAGVNIATEDAEKNRSRLDQDVSAQITDLQRKSAGATQLEPLKQLVSIRLHGINQQLQSYALQEQAEREKTQKELRNMLQKIRDMETETTELQSMLEAAQSRAARDPLTNLPNRLAFEERLTDEIARSHRYGTALALAVWDIDFFKNINDTYGHKSGDKALMAIAKLLSKHCREADFVARFGGEEFVMLLPETPPQSALKMADKLRENIEKSSFHANGERISITLSCGITQYIQGDDNESIFIRADNALYQAKQNGRNQCIAV
ncbi:MAG: diguanylate cyclase [Methylomonas sp.]|jgi:diguanylate cyclase|uniref:GGDEF domain-containing protein n=1 Tax=Methylomonas sp. TaxID=418 RepID=UPI0025F7E296|nr:GGDEF domain-containing protein [Methylomonas sp.]MCK9605524.1 diguanylate cyclase [Methylomonas sp.]